MFVTARRGQLRPSTGFIPFDPTKEPGAICRLPIALLQARVVYAQAQLPRLHLHLRALESGLDPPLYLNLPGQGHLHTACQGQNQADTILSLPHLIAPGTLSLRLPDLAVS